MAEVIERNEYYERLVKSSFIEQKEGYGPPTPVPIFQWEKEFTKLLELYKFRQPLKVLEIGTYHGGTLFHWLTKAARGATVVSVDSYKEGVDNRHLYWEWKSSDVTLVAIEGRSERDQTFRKVEHYHPFDWIFIDAGHKYDEVKCDWELYGTLRKQGGIVCFHDILPPSEAQPEIEVNKLWNEIKRNHRTEEIIADPKADWGGIGIVYERTSL